MGLPRLTSFGSQGQKWEVFARSDGGEKPSLVMTKGEVVTCSDKEKGIASLRSQ